MIYLVHGDDVVKSRLLVANQQKKLNVEKRIEFILGETNVESIIESSNATDLFGTPPFLVIEASKASKSALDDFAAVLERLNQSATVIIIFNKELTKTNPILQKAGALNIKTAVSVKELEGNVFKFVDALFSKNRKNTYYELQNLYKEDTDSFYIFSMVIYGLRNLANIAFESPNSAKMNPFVKTKTQTQLKNFNEESLKSIYTKFYELDKSAKTGVLDPDLALTLAIEKVLNS